ncbi:dihydroorotate dehydrogenase B (NAD(+)), electron transfer subunit [Bacteroidia bacterium]|nr:dihydroorotate dehydrogenase B (NAD(+)), electron transfer subunit [Bacteroidia bacterium]
MNKYIADWTVKENIRIHRDCSFLKLTLDDEIPEIFPGQFVQIKVEDSPATFLRRPISIHFVDREKHELWLLIQAIGDGTRKLAASKVGDRLNIIYPLGNYFSLPEDWDNPPIVTEGALNEAKPLLVGGGVGVAPLLYLGYQLAALGYKPTFLLGAKSIADLLQIAEFEKLGDIYVTTEDGSAGEKGFVTGHSVLQSEKFDFIYTCGPKPMMVAVAKYAKQNNIECEVSLENKMACGIGACLCCVEKTTYGNTCVCTSGPVFNINQLTWQI